MDMLTSPTRRGSPDRRGTAARPSRDANASVYGGGDGDTPPPGATAQSDESKKESHVNPFLAFLVLWTTQSDKDVTTSLPLHKRIYRLTRLFRENLLKIIEESLRKALKPWLLGQSAFLLQAAHVAVIAQAAIWATAEVWAFYQFFAFCCLSLLALEISNEVVRYWLRDSHLQNNALNTRVLIARHFGPKKLPHPDIQKQTPEAEAERQAVKAYNDARKADNDDKDRHTLAETFSFVNRKMLAFFIDCTIFIVWIGPSMLAVGLLVTLGVSGLSSWATQDSKIHKDNLRNITKEAKHQETFAKTQYQVGAVEESNKIGKAALAKYWYKRLRALIENVAEDWSYPAALFFYSFSVLRGGMDPIGAIVSAGIFRQMFKDLVSYLEVLDERQEFASTIKPQIKAIDYMDPDFFQRHTERLAAPYLPNTSKVNLLARFYIYCVALSIIAGLFLLPLPSIQPIVVAYLSQYSYQQMATAALGTWIAASFSWSVANLLRKNAHTVEETDGFYLFMLLLMGASCLSVTYIQALYATYAYIPWTTPMYLITAGTLCSTIFFDTCFFQYFAYGIDVMCIYLSQECLNFLEMPSNFGFECKRYAKEVTYPRVGALFKGAGSAMNRVASFFESSDGTTHKAATATV